MARAGFALFVAGATFGGVLVVAYLSAFAHPHSALHTSIGDVVIQSASTAGRWAVAALVISLGLFSRIYQGKRGS